MLLRNLPDNNFLIALTLVFALLANDVSSDPIAPVHPAMTGKLPADGASIEAGFFVVVQFVANAAEVAAVVDLESASVLLVRKMI